MVKKTNKFFSNYTNIIILLTIVTTFSGALRKWAGLPNLINNIFLLVLMVIPIYLVFFLTAPKREPVHKGLRIMFNIFLYIILLLALHPLNTSFYHGIFGILINLSFVGILISYLKNKNEFDISKITKLFFCILISQVIIATIQYSSPADSIINIYADNTQQDENLVDSNNGETNYSENGIALVGEAVRVTGTFPYLGGYTAILFFFLLFTFYLAKKKDTIFFFLLTPIIIYCSLLSGARASVGFVLILIILFFISEVKLFTKNLKSLATFLVITIGLLTFNFILGDKLNVINYTTLAYNNFEQRVTENEEESKGRLTNDLSEVFFRDFKYKQFGVGLGSTYQGANSLFGTSEIIRSTPIEGELFRIVVEGGIFFLFFKWLLIAVIFSYLNLPNLLKISFFIIFCIFNYTTFNIYNAIYISLGIICLNHAYVTDDKKTANK